MPSTTVKKNHQAEVIHPVTGARRRVAVETHRDKRLLSSMSLVREAKLDAALGRQTFAEAGRKYVERLLAEKKTQAAARLETILRLHLNPVMGTMLLRRVTRGGMAILADELRPRVKAASTHREHLNWICVILRNAFGDLECPVAFASDIPNRRERAAYGTAGLARNQVPIPCGQLLTRLLHRASGVLRILLHLLIHAGLRIGEALALTRADIVFEDRKGKAWITVSRSVRPNGELGPPKTKAGLRSIPINSALKAELLAWLEAVDGPRHMQLISDDPEKTYRYRAVACMHEKLQREIGGEVHGFHRYRAACVTTWLIAGIRLNDLISWIGHANLRTTIETYCHSIILAEDLWRAMHPDRRVDTSPEARMFAAVSLAG